MAPVSVGADDSASDAAGADAAQEQDRTVNGIDHRGMSTEYTWVIDKAEESIYYEEYEDGPVQQYWMNLGWDAYGEGTKTISVDFTALTPGSKKDMLNTQIRPQHFLLAASCRVCYNRLVSERRRGMAASGPAAMNPKRPECDPAAKLQKATGVVRSGKEKPS